MKLFTYGTLTADHFTMGNAEFIDKVKTDDEYFKGQTDWYPFLLEGPEKFIDNIYGNLWEIPEEDFKEIDRYEGAPTLFYRKLIEVKSLTNEDTFTAWCYFLNPKEL